MNKIFTACSAVLLTTTLGTAFAASSVDLSVTGLITPSACTPTLSSNGDIDLGKVSASDLNQDTYTRLPSSTLQMNLNCDASTLFALQGTDNRAASSTSSIGYGLGLIDDTQKIGTYHFQLFNAVADNQAVSALESLDGGLTWVELEDAAWQSKNPAAFGASVDGSWAPIPIQELTTDLVVTPTIAAANGLNLANEVQIDGSATLEVKYL